MALEQEDPDSGGRRDEIQPQDGQIKVNEGMSPQETEELEHGCSRKGIKAKSCGQRVIAQKSRSASLSSCLEWDSQEGVSHMACPGPGAF